MGLDIYLHSVQKNKELVEGKTYTREELEKYPNLTFFPVDEEWCKTILNNSTKIICIEDVFCADKLGIEAKLDTPAKYCYETGCSFGGGMAKSTFELEDENHKTIGTITIDYNDKELLNRVTSKKEYVYLACEMEEIDYQRKGLTDEGWDCLPNNCQYIDDYEAVKKITEHGLSSSFLDSWIPDRTVFHAWW